MLIEPAPSRLLMTFTLLAYNQETYVREAIHGAFAQTYSPLEIILSDDCSTDHTFDIIREMAEEYRGPHKVILNRNKRNLGVCEHVNTVLRLCSGDLIVPAAGDDVSLPHRCKMIYNSWITHGPWIAAYSSLQSIDASGRPSGPVMKGDPHQTIELAVRNNGVRLRGASHVWHRIIFDSFGELPTDTRSEDKIVIFRALLLGKVQFIDEALVLYRRHPKTLSGIRIPRWSYHRFLEHQKSAYDNQLRFLRVNYRDLLKAEARDWVPSADARRWARMLETRIRDLELYMRFLDSPSSVRRNLSNSFSDGFEVLRKEPWLLFMTIGNWAGILAYYSNSLRRRLGGAVRRVSRLPGAAAILVLRILTRIGKLLGLLSTRRTPPGADSGP